MFTESGLSVVSEMLTTATTGLAVAADLLPPVTAEAEGTKLHSCKACPRVWLYHYFKLLHTYQRNVSKRGSWLANALMNCFKSGLESANIM